MTWYSNNKEYVQRQQKIYKSTLEFKQRRLENDQSNRDHINELKRKWRRESGREKNRISKQKSDKKYYAKIKNDVEFKRKKQEYCKLYREKNKQKIIDYGKQYRKNNFLKEYERHKKYRLEHPRSNHSGSIEEQIVMNNVRIRDKQTCQWHNCNLTFREAPIHVHHIFPKSEYPNLKLIERYMICYCANHHGLWHMYRGDKYYKLITAKLLKLTISGRD